MGAAEFIAAWVVFLVVVLASSRLGALAPKVGLPLITGYLIVGALCGPYVLGVIEKPDVPRLSYVTQFALAFIAFSAGAELYLPELRSLFKRILYSTTMIALVTFAICTPVIIMISNAGIVPFMSALEPGCRSAVGAIAASIMTARSPASAIAVVKETRARGTFTSTLLGITVLSDVFVLVGFTLTTSIAESECNGEGFSVSSMGLMVAALVGDVVIGYIVGKFLIVLMMFKRFPARYLILPLGLAIFQATNWFEDYSQEELGVMVKFEPLMICIVAGYICTNQSAHRHRFLAVLQQAGPYVFLPFFTFTGASLDLGVMLKAIGFGAIMVLARAASITIGSFTGGWLAGQPKQHNVHMWMTLLTQAGVSLGLAAEVGMAFPEWGRAFQTSIIAVVLVNQIIGPVLFKIAIRRTGEAGKGQAEEGFDADATIPTALVLGYTPDSLAVAVRLLKEHWHVTLVAATPRQAAAAKEAIGAYFREDRAADARARGVVSSLVTGVTASLQQLGDKAVSVAVNAGSGSAHAHAPSGGPGVELTPIAAPITAQQEAWTGVEAVGGATPSDDPFASPGSVHGKGAGATVAAPPGAAGAGGKAGATAAATPVTPAPDAHDHHDGHGGPRFLEQGFSALALMEGEANNPFLPGGVSVDALATMSAPAAGEKVAAAGAAAYGGGASAASSTSATAAVVEDDGFTAVGSGTGVPGSGSARGAGTDFRYTALVQTIQSTRTLQCVAAMLPSDLANYAACEVVEATIAGAPKKSHLHSVRRVARVLNPAWGTLFDALGIAPLDSFYGSALLAAKVMVAPVGKPVVVMPPNANNDDLATAVGKWAGASVHQWSLEAAWREQFRKDAPEPPADLLERVHSHTTSAAAAAGAGEDAAKSKRAGGRAMLDSLKERIGGVGVGAEEVPEWQRGEYLDSLSKLQDEGAWDLHSANTDKRSQALGDMNMFGSVASAFTGKDGEEEERHSR